MHQGIWNGRVAEIGVTPQKLAQKKLVRSQKFVQQNQDGKEGVGHQRIWDGGDYRYRFYAA